MLRNICSDLKAHVHPSSNARCSDFRTDGTQSHKIAIYQLGGESNRGVRECAKSPVKVTSNQNRALNNETVSKQNTSAQSLLGEHGPFTPVSVFKLITHE